jgi:hypothetical protein
MAHHTVSTRPLLSLTLGLALLHPTYSSAEQIYSSGPQGTTLVELFTSQGCSSCPPAERWLGDLKDDPRLWQEIIPLAFHVDYWDYIGWRDIYAQRDFSSRQQRYRNEGKVASVYTPAFVVNGQEWRGWFSRKRSIPVSNSDSGLLRAKVENGRIEAKYTPPGKRQQELKLHVAVLGVGLRVEVSRGENAGRNLTQDFTVLGYKSMRSSDGNWNTGLPEITEGKPDRLALAVWISRPGKQGPIQAAGGWLEAEDR